MEILDDPVDADGYLTVQPPEIKSAQTRARGDDV
jgi:hypothetical protein